MLSDEVDEKIPYEYIMSILENFSKVLNGNISREQQKKLNQTSIRTRNFIASSTYVQNTGFVRM
ncbi:hypothetical protein D3C75_1005690 [compost metagenome]